MSKDEKGERKRTFKRKRRQEGEGKRKEKMLEKKGGEGKVGEVMSADQLGWKKVSLENDEFDDFEEIEGVDVEYLEKDGNKVIQFKVSYPRDEC